MAFCENFQKVSRSHIDTQDFTPSLETFVDFFFSVIDYHFGTCQHPRELPQKILYYQHIAVANSGYNAQFCLEVYSKKRARHFITVEYGISISPRKFVFFLFAP